MSAPTTPCTRWRVRQRLLVALVLIMTIGTLVLVVVNAVRLGEQTEEIKAAQVHSTNLANSTREALVLLQAVTELGERTDGRQLAVQRGLLARQIAVSIASFPPDAPQARELEEVRLAIARFPWDRLPERHTHDSPLRLAAMALVGQSERRINALRSDEEKLYYSATIESLDGNRRSQLGLAAAVAVIVVLGVVGVTAVLRRSRTNLEEAYEALQEEMGERHAAEAALRASEGRFRSLVQRASDLTIVTDEAGVVGYVSPAAEALLGHRPDDLVDRLLTDLVDAGQVTDVVRAITLLAERPGLVHTIELRLRTRDGRVRWVEAVCQNLVNDADVRGLVWNGRDVTDRRALEDELIRQAHHDPLTGLPNRMLLLERLERALRTEPAERGCVSVLVGDLDGFKNVNDTLGHPAGDELLRAAAQRLLGCVRDGDTVARLGGDEFAVLVAADAPQHAVSVGHRIVDVLHRPFTVAGTEVMVSASVGVAHQQGEASAEDLLRDADIAMYVAKHTGKGRLEVFEPEMRTRASYRTSLQQQLARAVDLGEIEVHYQPIMCLKTMRPTSLEALVRWRRPDGSLVSADVFVPLAEESGVIDEIGREVLRQACLAIGRWRGLPGQADLGARSTCRCSRCSRAG